MRLGQQPPDDVQRDGADRQVDPEDPVPADVVRQPAAEQRAHDRRDPEHRPEEALVLAAFGRREHVADDRERDREQRTGAEALDAAEQDQLLHRTDSPESAEPMRNSETPIISSGLRPYRSDSLP
jgi:hypothetical protein